MNGIITDIQHASVHDGPGFRSVVFLKGCQMRCFWCHNPETLQTMPRLSLENSKCLFCGRCAAVCNVHSFADGKHLIDYSRCSLCGRCVRACLPGALSVCGRSVTVDEVIDDIAEDMPFYKNSGGGVTVSGGEPGCQAEFTAGILKRCRELGIHTAIETNLGYGENTLNTLLEYCDLVMADLKHIDPEKHQQGTGCSNLQTLEHLKKITKPLILRTPVIPGFNDDDETIRQMAAFAAGLPSLLYYDLLTYHPLGVAKALRLGMTERGCALEPLSSETMRRFADIAKLTGVTTYLNGKEI